MNPVLENYTTSPHFLKGGIHIKDKNLHWGSRVLFLK